MGIVGVDVVDIVRRGRSGFPFLIARVKEMKESRYTYLLSWSSLIRSSVSGRVVECRRRRGRVVSVVVVVLVVSVSRRGSSLSLSQQMLMLIVSPVTGAGPTTLV